jgi:AcrR family transcriptional regulator
LSNKIFTHTQAMKAKAEASVAREPGLRERKKADLKRRIADTALALMRERGFERTTIDEIVKRVDVSQPTFYKYYPSKEAILREHGMTTFGALIQDQLARSGSVAERMRRFLQGVARQMSADRDLWYAIAISNAYNPIRDPELLTSAEAATRVVEAAIEQGRKQGEFTSAYTARRLASLLEGIVFRVCVEWGANYPVEHALDHALDEAFDLFLRAARPQPGDKPARKRRAAR